MSGDTEELTVESALIWTDNPELEYFRSVMSNRVGDRMAAGLDTEDSLLGESIMREMLGENDPEEFDGRNADGRREQRDTSGLSDLENDTVDNIYIEDDASNFVKNNRLLDDGTIESPIDEELAPRLGTALPRSNKQEHNDSQEQISIPLSNEFFRYQPADVDPLPRNMGRYAVHDDVTLASNPRTIPGIIYVTDGHSSVIATRADPTKMIDKDDPVKPNRKRLIRYCVILFLAVVILASSLTAAVLVARQKRIQSSSSFVTDGSSDQNQNSSPTMAPSNLRPNARPSEPPTLGLNPIGTPSAPPTKSPIVSPILSLTSSPTTSPVTPPSAPPTKRPTFPPTMAPTVSPTASPTTMKPTIPPTNSPTGRPNISLTASPTTSPQTKEPTVAPIMQATEIPTPEGTQGIVTPPDCVSTLSTTETCFENGSEIVIEFTNCNPTWRDWIGIYPSWHDADSLGQPYAWLWTCGTQLCRDPVLEGTATLFNYNGFGSFQVILLEDTVNGSSSSVKAIGNTFSISNNCDE